jgi:hypothetical protein
MHISNLSLMRKLLKICLISQGRPIVPIIIYIIRYTPFPKTK